MSAHSQAASRGALAVLGLAALSACAGMDRGAAEESDRSRDVTVFAAASLTEAFGRLADAYEEDHPGATVTLSTAGSSALVQQVRAGAPADVLATADRATMQPVVDAGLVRGEPRVVARNALVLAVPPGNPGRVRGLADLADPDRTVALCAPQVPCGAAAERVFAAAGLRAAPDTLEQDVRAVLTKVRLGEVDAGLVYRTDVRAAGDDVVGLPVPEAAGAVNDYPVAVLADAPSPDAASAFVAHVRSPEGQRVLADAGFTSP